ncbi:hypothetical protein [Rickettsiella endosymbiont of Miltochrista miniata]|uniref:hypothetical protein n=1 Tax=Rickettsiella endosymbiont of Miltochrista miniata TaxID=3066239 RepID=UPI00313DDE90
MRIFNLDTILSFALYPDGNKKRNRNSQGYCLNINRYSKNGCDVTDTGTLKNHLKNMKVLCLGVLTTESKNINQIELGSVKFRVKKTEQYKVKKEFQSPNEDIPLPFFLFYKKKKTKPIIALKALKALTDILKPFFSKIISLHQGKNLKLKKLAISKEDIMEINNEYQMEVTKITKNIFENIEISHSGVNIVGLFVDPYFIRKVEGILFLEDTRPSDTLPRQNISILQQHTCLEDDSNHELIESETESYDSSEAIVLNGGNISDISLSSESTQVGFNDLFDVVSEETDKDLVGGIYSDLEECVQSIDLTTSRQDEEEIIAPVQSTPSPVAHIQAKPDDWNADAKNRINDLLVAYQKHLSQKFFFRNNEIQNVKLSITESLLEKLQYDTYKSFSDFFESNKGKKILETHRDLLVIQKIGQFFKCHNKTEGTLLLENIFFTLENNPLRNSVPG